MRTLAEFILSYTHKQLKKAKSNTDGEFICAGPRISRKVVSYPSYTHRSFFRAKSNNEVEFIFSTAYGRAGLRNGALRDSFFLYS